MKSLMSVEHAFGSNVIFASTNIELPDRGVVALRGSNGSGKTTLLKLLGGVIPSSCGAFRDWRNKFTAVYLDIEYLTLDYLTASELLDMIRPLTGPVPDNGLLNDAILATKVSDLSLGQRQRLVLAAALALQNIDVVLLDEPLNGLDREASKAARDALRAASQDRLVILATHEDDRWADYDLTIGRDRKVVLSKAGVVA